MVIMLSAQSSRINSQLPPLLSRNVIWCILNLTIGSCVSVLSSRYEARDKLGKYERCVRVPRGVAEGNSSLLSNLQTSRVHHISVNAQLTHEPIVLQHFQRSEARFMIIYKKRPH